MRLRRLGWAGIELESQGEHLVIDHLIDPGILKNFFTDERDELLSPEAGSVSAALITHLHRDHADVEAIEAALAPGGVILRPPSRANPTKHDEITTGESEAALAATKFEVRECWPGDSNKVGPFIATAVFASDGLGSPQVSWVVEADGQRIFHGGDTLWHGAWWDIALVHGSIDVAFLPANGVELAYPHMQPPAKTPAVMAPEQTVDAAAALKAARLIPIHYNRTFEHPDYYRPIADAQERLTVGAEPKEFELKFLEPGEWLEVAAEPALA